MNTVLEKGLSKNKSDVNNDLIYKGLKKDINKLQYDKIWVFWLAYINNITNPRLVQKTLTYTRYKRKFTSLDIYYINITKYVTKAIGLLTSKKLDKVNRMLTINIIQIKIRKLMLIYTRKTGCIIPKDVYSLIALISIPTDFFI